MGIGGDVVVIVVEDKVMPVNRPIDRCRDQRQQQTNQRKPVLVLCATHEERTLAEAVQGVEGGKPAATEFPVAAPAAFADTLDNALRSPEGTKCGLESEDRKS